MLSAFCEEQIVEVLKEWDCIGIKEFEPSGYDDAASMLAETLTYKSETKDIVKKVKKTYKQLYDDSFDVSDAEIEAISEKIKEIIEEDGKYNE
ncbi:MAG: hypothetical protein ILA17_07810 [Ruminococcus sp.]|nr:hypothetical protein [Ruminococcus sp.]MBP1537760.1 hypothetical protein [Ruminococcus sp.]